MTNAGLAAAPLAGAGMVDLPPLVQPELPRDRGYRGDAEMALQHLPFMVGAPGETVTRYIKGTIGAYFQCQAVTLNGSPIPLDIQ